MPAPIRVVICAGTACHVMGGSHLFLVSERLSPEVRARVSIEGSPCLDRCHGPGSPAGAPSPGGPAGGAPYAMVDGVPLAGADVESLAAAIEARFRELGA